MFLKKCLKQLQFISLCLTNLNTKSFYTFYMIKSKYKSTSSSAYWTWSLNTLSAYLFPSTKAEALAMTDKPRTDFSTRETTRTSEAL